MVCNKPAKSENSVQLHNVNRRADLFQTKPIDESLLLAQIENILVNRVNLVEKLNDSTSTPKYRGKKVSFIERVEKYILDNIRNEQLDINIVANEL